MFESKVHFNGNNSANHNLIINGKKYYRVSEVCRVLGIFKNTLYNWEKKGKIPKAHRDPMSGWRLYSTEDLERIKRISGRG